MCLREAERSTGPMPPVGLSRLSVLLLERTVQAEWGPGLRRHPMPKSLITSTQIFVLIDSMDTSESFTNCERTNVLPPHWMYVKTVSLSPHSLTSNTFYTLSHFRATETLQNCHLKSARSAARSAPCVSLWKLEGAKFRSSSVDQSK